MKTKILLQITSLNIYQRIMILCLKMSLKYVRVVAGKNFFRTTLRKIWYVCIQLIKDIYLILRLHEFVTQLN